MSSMRNRLKALWHTSIRNLKEFVRPYVPSKYRPRSVRSLGQVVRDAQLRRAETSAVVGHSMFDTHATDADGGTSSDQNSLGHVQIDAHALDAETAVVGHETGDIHTSTADGGTSSNVVPLPEPDIEPLHPPIQGTLMASEAADVAAFIAAEPVSVPTTQQSHIVSEIDLGEFGKVVKRQPDQWFKKEKRKHRKDDLLDSVAVPIEPAPIEPLISAVSTIAGTPPRPSLADVAAQITTPTTQEELNAVLDLLEKTPEFSSGRYHVEPPVGGFTDATYNARLFPHNEDAGIFHFRGHLLEQLDQYFVAIAHMKAADRDAYDVFSRVGANVMPCETLGSSATLPSLWHDRKKRPSFGCVSFCGDIKESPDPRDTNMIRLAYFEKMSAPPPEVEPSKYDVYRVTKYYDEWDPRRGRIPKWLKHGLCFQFWYEVGDNNDVRLLKTLQTKTERTGRANVKTRRLLHRKHDGYKTHHSDRTSITYQVWDYPPWLGDWYKDICRDYPDMPRHETIEMWTATTFRWLVNAAITIEFAVRVSITNQRGDTAAFAVNPERFGYFFKDRDAVLDHRGRKARIFHKVKPHMRTLRNGQVIAISQTFRGARRFKWGPYSVHITVSGLDHIPVTDWNVGMLHVDAIPPSERRKKDWIYADEIGKSLQRHIGGDSIHDAFTHRPKRHHPDK
jgi:hypothetical protein